jgi:selenide,water dikinase
MGLFPAGAYRNKEFHARHVDFAPSVYPLLQDILFDPQTSGGLLICVEGGRAEALVRELREQGVAASTVVGEVIPRPVDRIVVR